MDNDPAQTPITPNQAPQQTQPSGVPQNQLTPDQIRNVAYTGKVNDLTPDQVEEVATEIHSSKIVKFGGGFLYLFWLIVIGGMVGMVGVLAWIAVTVAIYFTYRWFHKTKSPIAFSILVGLIGLLTTAMVILQRKH